MDLNVRLVFKIFILYFHIQNVIAMEIKMELMKVKEQTSLQNPYKATQLGEYNVIFCGFMCMVDINCTASTLSKTNLLCEFYKDQLTSEVLDFDKTLISKPIKWPKGTYTLMKPLTGCPGTDVAWKEGSVYQDTENDNQGNGYVILTNMTLVHDGLKNIRVYFCTKDNDDSDRVEWPPGNYCILKYNTCPTGFASGYIAWDDEDTNNANEAAGTLPSGSYTTDTMVEYCCRDDGAASTPIFLPKYDPFYLLRFTGECQIVHGMSVVEESIVWDCQDGGFSNTGLVRPFEDGPSNNIQLHFCYYYI